MLKQAWKPQPVRDAVQPPARASKKSRLTLSSLVAVVRGKGRGQIEQTVRPDQEDEPS